MLNDLSKPFFVLAPMDDVTDTVFRQIIASTAAPDLFFTEFVNVDGLQSAGRDKLLFKLRHTKKEHPLVGQIWGKTPENFYKTAQDLVKMGYDGIDLNFGCPAVAKSGTCIGMINNRGLVAEIIAATKQGVAEATKKLSAYDAKASHLSAAQGDGEKRAESYKPYGEARIASQQRSDASKTSAQTIPTGRGRQAEVVRGFGGSLPVSVKTRLGLQQIDFTWHEFLLKQKLNMLTIHGRTAKEMSKVPVHWDAVEHIRELRDQLSPTTLIVGNGDIMNRAQGEELAKKYQLDGIMIGRGVFHDPYAFASTSPWETKTKKQKIALYRQHVKLFADTWKNNERKIHTLNKFCKVYISDFDGAKEMREELMVADSAKAILSILDQH